MTEDTPPADQPGSSEQPRARTPRRDIASASRRALRAARGDASAAGPATPPVEVASADPVEAPVEAPAEAPADADTADTADTAAPVEAHDTAPAKSLDEVTPEAPEPVEPAGNDEPPTLAAQPVRRRSSEKGAKTKGAKTKGAKTPPAAVKPARRPVRPLTIVAGSVAAAALVFGVISGVVWWNTDHADARAVAVARDDVVVDARVAVATVNTSDYRHPDAALTNWLDVSTGTLHSEFADSRTVATKLLAQAKMITTATVLEAAVSKVDPDKGTATVLVSMNLKKQPTSGAATVSRNRFRATLKKVGGDWKLNDLTLIPATLS